MTIGVVVKLIEIVEDVYRPVHFSAKARSCESAIARGAKLIILNPTTFHTYFSNLSRQYISNKCNGSSSHFRRYLMTYSFKDSVVKNELIFLPPSIRFAGLSQKSKKSFTACIWHEFICTT